MTNLTATEPADAATGQSNSRKARIRSGVTLDYAERGEPAGRPVILLHGYTDSWRSYQPLIAALPPGLRLIAVSHRGHGDSDKPSSRYDTAELADDVGHFMDSLGIDRAVIVGHSMSSQVAQRFAAVNPRRTQALILLGAFTTLTGHADVQALLQGVDGLADPVDPAFVEAFQQSTLARPVPPAFFEMIVAESRKVPAHVWRTALRGTIDEDCSRYLATITAPTLVLWGDRDTIGSRDQQDQIKTSIADTSLITHPGIGHSPHWEDPHRAAGDIVAFLDGAVHEPRDRDTA